MKLLHETAQKALNALKDGGATRAACTASRAVTQEFNAEGGEFTLMRTLFDDALSMTGFVGGKKGSVGINRLDDASIAQAAEDCLAACASAEDDPDWQIAAAGEGSFTDGAPEVDLEKFFDRVRELYDEIAAQHPSIVLIGLFAMHTSKKSVYRNSEGVCYERTGGAYQLTLTFCARDGEATSSMFGTGAMTDSLDEPFLSLGTIKRDLEAIEKQVHTTPFSGKFTGTVVLTPECFSTLLSSLFTNFAGDAAILGGTSAWKDSLGKQVADPRISVMVAAEHASVVLPQRWTAEGFAPENYDVIRDGVLKSFQISQHVANRMNQSRAGNDTDTNFVIDAGEKCLDELLAGIEKGLYVARFSGGAPAANGDFSGVAKNSFLIENGKLGPAVSEVMISGNLAELLNHVVGMSAERVSDGAGLVPWAAFDGVTVSGR